MSYSNLDTVKALYDAFAAGNIPAALALMADDIVWREAENFPLADRNPYVGPQAVLEGVFMRLGDDLDEFAVHPERYIDGGDSVVMTGRYSAVAKTTSRPVNPQVVHIWTVERGKLATFQQHIDTLAVALATGAATSG